MDIIAVIELATKAGAGLLTIILCIATYTLWNKLEAEQLYVRQRDEETIKVLTSISATLASNGVAIDVARTMILGEVTRLHDLITKQLLHLIEELNEDLKVN